MINVFRFNPITERVESWDEPSIFHVWYNQKTDQLFTTTEREEEYYESINKKRDPDFIYLGVL